MALSRINSSVSLVVLGLALLHPTWADGPVIEDLPLDPGASTIAPPPPAKPDPAPTPVAQLNDKTWLRLQNLEDANRRMLGTLEDQQHEIDQLKQELKQDVLNLDQRLTTLEAKVAQLAQPQPANPNSTAPNSSSPAGAVLPSGNDVPGTATDAITAEKNAYLAAYNVYRNQGPDAAIPGMMTFIHQYPSSVFLPHAEYWLGEFYMNKQAPDLNKASAYFVTVLKQYPKHAKAPAAMYNLAMIEAAQKKKKEAATTLRKLLKTYPDSAQTQLAKSWLDRQDKHAE